jgi:hypothetical protein
MKKQLFIYGLIGLTAFSCSKDEVPEEINEEELITTVEVALSSAEGNVNMVYRDLDADGPQTPTINVSGPLKSGVRYVGTITFLNESESPAEDVTEEVEDESDEHQVFFVANGFSLNLEYLNNDGNGQPLGTEFAITPTTGSGTLTVILRHLPTKPNNGNPDTAGGETDVLVTFSVNVQ